jgi:hypothetical protein
MEETTTEEEEEESWSEYSDPATEISSSSCESNYSDDPIEYITDPDMPGPEEVRNAWIVLKRQYCREITTRDTEANASVVRDAVKRSRLS